MVFCECFFFFLRSIRFILWGFYTHWYRPGGATAAAQPGRQKWGRLRQSPSDSRRVGPPSASRKVWGSPILPCRPHLPRGLVRAWHSRHIPARAPQCARFPACPDLRPPSGPLFSARPPCPRGLRTALTSHTPTRPAPRVPVSLQSQHRAPLRAALTPH